MKKFLSVLLCLVMLASTLAASVGAAQYNPEILDEDNLSITQPIMKDQTFILGDVNGDENVDAKDALYMSANVLGLPGYAMNEESADFSADGEFDTKDVYYMKMCLSGLSSTKDYGDNKQLYKFTIGGYDIKDYTLVIPTDAVYDSNLYFATELLYEYIKIATGHALTIERGDKSGAHAIFLHNVEDDSEQGAALGHEGYTYRVDDGDLHIYGTHRGNMYAAYEIIEDYLGFNFFSSQGTFSFKQRCVDLPEETDVTFVPKNRFRHSKSTLNQGVRESFYLARGLNGAQNYSYKNEKRSLEYYGDFVGPVFINIHSYAYYHQMATGTMPPDDGVTPLEARYYEKYQSGEFKDETKWEPCATDPAVYDQLYGGFLDTLHMIEARGYPIKYQDGTNCFSFSINDNSNWHDCRNCRKQSQSKTYMGLYVEMANKAARDVQADYPGLKIYTWVYIRELPTNVLPDENLILVLSGFNCANHHLGSDECSEIGSFFGFGNKHVEEVIDGWADLCAQTGAEIWLWYYPESHYFFFYDIPNIYTIYYDFQWMSEHGINGVFYEGSGGKGYMFENLKAYLAAQMNFDPDMSFEKYEQLLKDYCYMAYGDGWENIYELIQMYEAAGDAVGFETGNPDETTYCYIGNYDRGYDLVSVAYLQENYETMRNLILAAMDEFDSDKCTNDDYRVTRLKNLFYCFEILGLGATYVPNYVNGTASQRTEYENRYTEFFNYAKNTGMVISSMADFQMPAEMDLSTNPAEPFIVALSRRDKVLEMLGA